MDRGNPAKNPEVKVICFVKRSTNRHSTCKHVELCAEDKEDNLEREQSAIRSLLQLLHGRPPPAEVESEDQEDSLEREQSAVRSLLQLKPESAN